MAETEMWINPFTGVREPAPPRAPRGFVVSDGKVPKDLVDTPNKKKTPPAKKAPPAKAKQDKAADKVKAKQEKAKQQDKGKKDKAKASAKKSKPAEGDIVTSQSDGDQLTIEAIADEMDALREKYAALKNRQGAEAQKMVKRYRYLTLAFSKLGPEGIVPPKLWEDIDTSTATPQDAITTDEEWATAAPKGTPIAEGTVEAKAALLEEQAQTGGDE